MSDKSKRKRETVLVTGAAGTVGGYLVRELVARGHRVIATDRPGCRMEFDLPKSTSKDGEGAGEGAVELRPGDITDLSFCVDAVAGADSVVHVAAVVDLNMAEDTVRKVNVDAVRYLYEAARARGCRRFVFF